jgi:class 3 adenylate cyclase
VDADNAMKVFISWSGSRSGEVANALARWLPSVLPATDPWVSSDIPAGGNWYAEISQRLGQAHTGILCVTEENMNSPWLLFEAGALSRAGRLVVYLVDLDATQIAGPLAQLQATKADKRGTWELVTTVNKATEDGVIEQALRGNFEQSWPRLERLLAATGAPRLETVSIVLADIVNSSLLSATGGDLAARKAFQDFFTRANELQRFHNGKIIEFVGDGFLATFLSVNEAFAFAVELQTSLFEKPLLVGDVPLTVRTALHWGPVQRTQTSSGRIDVAGMAIDLAARITRIANPGQIIVSGDAYAELSNKHRKLLGPIERTSVKGFESQVEVSRFGPVEVLAKK